MKGSTLIAFLEHKGVTRKEFADKIGVSKSQVSRWKEVDKLNTKSVNKILEHYPDAMEYAMKHESQVGNVADRAIPEGHKSKYLSVYELDPDYQEKLMNKKLNPQGYIDIDNFVDADGAFIQRGDALSGAINGGDVMGHKEWKPRNYFIYGKIHIIKTKDHWMTRYLKKHQDANFVLLKSNNDFYDDIDLPITEIEKLFVVNGAVVQW